MSQCSRIAAQALSRGHVSLARGPARFDSAQYCARFLLARGSARFDLGACFLLFASACTDPVFTPGPNRDAGLDAAAPLPPPQLEPGDSGAELSTPSNCGIGCQEEAGSLPTSVQEAGAPDSGNQLEPDAGIDPLRLKWMGRYAARSTLFSFDDPLKNTSKLLSIVAIVPNASGGLTLEEEMCFYQGGWSFLYTGQLTYTYVNTRGSTALQYSEDDFESELMKLHIGYGPTPPECRAGGTLMKREYQAWLSATCDCPRNEDTPTSARDCRVTDQEGDLAPGATFPATIDTQAIRYRTAQEERVQFREGYRLGERLYADRVFEDTTRVLECTVNEVQTSAARCPQGVPKPCPSKYNKVELFKIPDNYDCERVIAQEHALFVSPAPGFPDACPAELSGALRE